MDENSILETDEIELIDNMIVNTTTGEILVEFKNGKEDVITKNQEYFVDSFNKNKNIL